MITKSLENLGLSTNEIKIYLALLSLGLTKAGRIREKTGLQNSVVHLTLGQLLEKGLVSFINKGHVRNYQACDPRHILELLEERKNSFVSILPDLLNLQKTDERQQAEVFEGMTGFKVMLYKFIEDAKPGEDYLFFAFLTESGTLDHEVNTFYKDFRKDRMRRGLKIKGIAHKSVKDRFDKVAYDYSDVRFVDFPTLQNVSICHNKVIMTPWDDRQVSFMITSQQLARNFQQYFYSLWNQQNNNKKVDKVKAR